VTGNEAAMRFSPKRCRGEPARIPVRNASAMGESTWAKMATAPAQNDSSSARS
jgi:hypothetical protein